MGDKRVPVTVGDMERVLPGLCEDGMRRRRQTREAIAAAERATADAVAEAPYIINDMDSLCRWLKIWANGFRAHLTYKEFCEGRAALSLAMDNEPCVCTNANGHGVLLLESLEETWAFKQSGWLTSYCDENGVLVWRPVVTTLFKHVLERAYAALDVSAGSTASRMFVPTSRGPEDKVTRLSDALRAVDVGDAFRVIEHRVEMEDGTTVTKRWFAQFMKGVHPNDLEQFVQVARVSKTLYGNPPYLGGHVCDDEHIGFCHARPGVAYYEGRAVYEPRDHSTWMQQLIREIGMPAEFRDRLVPKKEKTERKKDKTEKTEKKREGTGPGPDNRKKKRKTDDTG